MADISAFSEFITCITTSKHVQRKALYKVGLSCRRDAIARVFVASDTGILRYEGPTLS